MDEKKKIRKIKKFRKISNIVNDIISEHARCEAIDILLLTTNKELDDFFIEYQDGSGNTCCLMIDTIKMRLVNENKMILNKDDNFGDEEFLSFQ